MISLVFESVVLNLNNGPIPGPSICWHTDTVCIPVQGGGERRSGGENQERKRGRSGLKTKKGNQAVKTKNLS